MSTMSKLAIVAGDAELRVELADICRLAGYRVSSARAALPDRPGGLGADVAIVQGPLNGGTLPECPTVVVLAGADPRTVTATLREGAAGVVERGALIEALPVTVAAVACGQLCVPRTFADETERPILSTREKQILGMVVLGFANIEIAQRLFVAESTVKSHLNSAFRKLGVRSRVEATSLILNPTSGLGPGILTIPTSDPDPQRSSA
jgi:DNA-binding CsgD family transcriptional regulator